MHTITKNVRGRVHRLKVDSGTKAGILAIFEHSGHLKSAKDLRSLSERERDWFSQGFSDYLVKNDHPMRRVYAQFHYGRVIFVLGIIYFFTILTWVTSLMNLSLDLNRDVIWQRVGIWLMSTIATDAVLLIYGTRLEKMSYGHHLRTIHRIMALVIIITLTLGIVSNMFAPYMAGDNLSVIQTFLYPR